MKILPRKVHRVAMVARWKPVHLGQAEVLTALSAWAEETCIGIGSGTTLDARNPFTAEESAAMIRLCWPDTVPLRLEVFPDLHDGPRWRAMVVERLGQLDYFVTANRYVRDLLAGDYDVIHPVALVAPERRVAVDGTMVRRAMVCEEDWATLVPEAVAAWIRERGLDRRVREEFGQEILAERPRRVDEAG